MHVPEVRTKSSVSKQKIKQAYQKLIIENSKGFRPIQKKKYVVCVRFICSNKRSNYPDVENVTKEIIDTLFPDGDSIKVITGVQTEGKILDIGQNEEHSEVYIYELSKDS